MAKLIVGVVLAPFYETLLAQWAIMKRGSPQIFAAVLSIRSFQPDELVRLQSPEFRSPVAGKRKPDLRA
jgi:hypothetical protein